MTVNPSRTKEYNINQIITLAYKMAGLLHYGAGLDNARGSFGRDQLELVIKHLETLGIQTKARDFEYLTLIAGTDTYSLSNTVLDCIEDGMYIAAGEADVTHPQGSTLIQQMDATQLMRISNRQATSRPTRFFADKTGALVQVVFWPIPNEAGTAKLMVQRLLPDSTDGNATAALERPWQDFFQFEVAWRLAESQGKGRDKIQSLKATANEKLTECRGFSNQRVPIQVVLDHNGGYSGGYGHRRH